MRGALLAILALIFNSGCGTPSKPPSIRFEISLSNEAARQIAEFGLDVPIVGRLFAIVSRGSDKEPRLGIGVTGNPIFGVDVRNYSPGQTVILSDEEDSFRGSPFEKLRDLPPGEYSVQAFLNVYTTFHRSDGKTLEMHLDAGEHQHAFRSPGNAYSDVRKMTFKPGSQATIPLILNKVIQPQRPLREGEVYQQGNLEDTEWVKHLKIKSEKLSEFWGRDIYIGANVLLPKGYQEHPDVYYPVLYMQGHTSGWTPVPWSPEEWFFQGYSPSDPGVGRQLDGFYESWTAGKLPKLIVVSFRDSNPFYDTSYSVNSANVGPYGDAIMKELIPDIEKKFRIISKPWARVLAGRSTGGWEAAAMMIFYPDFFAGSWPWAPDPVDFRKYELINIYEDNNAFYREYDWIKTERPEARDTDGQIRYSVKKTYQYEQTIGDKDRSGEQWAIWQAVYSPVGPDGYPKPLWDPKTGMIDKEVARYWRDNYDLSYILKRDWATLGPKLRGKLHFAVGMMDNYYLNEAVYLVQDTLESLTNPPAEATFQYGFRGRHSWIGHGPLDPSREMTYAEFISVIADYITKNAPSGANTSAWKYK